MDIYTVEHFIPYEGIDVVMITTDKKKALEKRDELNKKYNLVYTKDDYYQVAKYRENEVMEGEIVEE